MPPACQIISVQTLFTILGDRLIQVQETYRNAP